MYIIKINRNEKWYTLLEHNGTPKGFKSADDALNHADEKGYFGEYDIDIVEVD